MEREVRNPPWVHPGERGAAPSALVTWRFPYITGEYGGAAFVIMYLVFLAIFALPALIMEFAAGRAPKRSIARSYDVLEPAGNEMACLMAGACRQLPAHDVPTPPWGG